MKVYVVLMDIDWNNYRIEGVFANKELAEAFEATYPEDSETMIEEHEVQRNLTTK